MTAADMPYQVRRAPTQYRASRQIERIIDAASAVVLAKGYSAATTADIAKAAKVSIGSVYRYFPDKLAVMKAVVERNTQRYQQRVQAEAPTLPTWQAAVGRAYAIFVDMWRTDDGFRAVGRSGLLLSELEAPDELDDPLAEALAEVLVRHYGFADTPELRVSMLQAVTIGEVMTRLAFRLGVGGHEETLDQADRVIRDLIAPHAH